MRSEIGNKTGPVSPGYRDRLFDYLRKNARGAAVFHVGLTGASKLVVFFGVLVLAKILDTAEFGYYSVIQMLLLYAGLSHFGLLDAATKEYPILSSQGKKDEADSLFLASFHASMVLTALISGLISLWLYGRYKDSALAFTFFITAVSFQATAYGIQYFRINQRFKMFNIATFLQSVFPVVLLVLFSYAARSIAVYAGFSLSFGILGILSWLLSANRIKSGLTSQVYRKWIKAGFRIGLPIYMIILTSWILRYVDRLFVAQFFELGTFASYSLASRVSEVVNVFPFAVATIYYPVLLGLVGKGSHAEAKLLVKRVTRISMILSATAALCLMLLNRYFLKGHFEKYPEYDLYVDILSIASCLWSWTHMYMYYFIAYDSKILLKVIAFPLVIDLVLLGYIAVAGSQVSFVCLAVLGVSLLYLLVLRTLYGMRSEAYGR